MEIEFVSKWKTGQIKITVESIEELSDTLKQLKETKDLEVGLEITEEEEPTSEMPTVPGDLGCSDAIKEILKSPWGKAQPRTMNELVEAMKASGVFFPKTTVSGALTRLTKAQAVRRMKRNGRWSYVYSE